MIESETDSVLDQAAFRRAMGYVATGLAVVTGAGTAGPVGFVVNSFTSVSLTPPLVLFCAAHKSTTWPQVCAAGAFCLNVLASSHEELARDFVSKHPERFARSTWRTETSGAPVLDDALMWLDCRLHKVYDAGDHVVVLGRVLSFGLTPGADTRPLIFYRGALSGWST